MSPPANPEAEARAAEARGVIDMHRLLRRRLEDAIPAMVAAADAVSACSSEGSPPEPIGAVLRESARRIQASVSAWNAHEARFESASAADRESRDRASTLVSEALRALGEAAKVQLALDRAVAGNRVARSARAHRRLQLRELGRVLSGSVAVMARLVKTVAAHSPSRYEDMIESASSPGEW